MTRRYPCVEQHDIRDCGPACLASVCHYYGKRIALAQVRAAVKTDAEGTSLYGLVEGARHLGFEADALGGPIDELLEEIESDAIVLPAIAHTVTEDFFLHFIVVYKITHDRVFIADPARGRSSISIDEFSRIWTGNLISLTTRDDFERENSVPSLLGFFRSIVVQQKMLAFAILFCSLVLAAAGIATAFIFQIIIDKIVTRIGFVEANELLWILGGVSLAVAGLFLLDALFRLIRGFCLAVFSRKLDAAIILKSYNHTIDLSLDFFSSRKTGEIISRFSDAQTIRDMLASATFSIVVDGLMVVFGAIILWLISPLLTLVACSIVLIYAIVVLLFRQRIRKINQLAMENSAQVTSYFKESIDGIETIKALNLEEDVKAKTSKTFSKLLESSFRQSIIYNNLNVLIGAFTSLGTVMILWLGVQGIFQGVLTLGALITFNALLGHFLTPVGNLIGLQPQLQAANVATNRLNDIMLSEKEDREIGAHLTTLSGDIVFDDVSFRYGTRELTLQNVSFSIKHGEKLALVGQSGSGKTTLMRLLVGFYRPESGSIRIDGLGLDAISKQTLRSRISYLTQDIFLFADSIKNNICYGNEVVSDEELLQICKECQVDDFARKMPLGYDTRLEENGANLSGGQKQRIALARALLRKPDILILDEAMSSLDAITEKSLTDTIAQLDSGITCIVIAHRLSSIVQCDKIVVMDSGHVVEEGTHDSLMQKHGKYRSFWAHQGQD